MLCDDADNRAPCPPDSRERVRRLIRVAGEGIGLRMTPRRRALAWQCAAQVAGRRNGKT